VSIGAAASTMVSRFAEAVPLCDQDVTSSPAAPALVRVHAVPAQVLNSFDPDQSLATSMDIQSRGSIQKIYIPETVDICLSAGWGPISYRLHTPETIDYWHWNPNGRWTDEANQRGYFVGSSELDEPIRAIPASPMVTPTHSGRATLTSPKRSPTKTTLYIRNGSSLTWRIL
jgi:hypothetical protein